MLARTNRLTRASEFKLALRGRRVATASLLVHWRAEQSADRPRVGFIVSRSVGNAVIRNRTKRRLRNACRDRIDRLPGPGLLVVRATPTAGAASYAALEAELDDALDRLSGESARNMAPGSERGGR